MTNGPSLFCQGGEPSHDLLLLSNTDPKHLPGFLSGRGTAQGRQTNGDLIGIFDLDDSMLLAQPKERFEWISGHR